MKNRTYYQTLYVLTVFIFLILGCKNLSTGAASLTDLKISADKEGKIETRNFKSGETVFANAHVSGDTSKVKVLFYVEDERNQKLNGSQITVELEGSENAYFNLRFPTNLGSEKFYIIAELIRDENSPKTTSVTQLRQRIEVN